MKPNRFWTHRILPVLIAVMMLGATVPFGALTIHAAVVTTPATGYTQASDVPYKSFTEGKYSGVMNWGARGEDCIFLPTPALEYYTGEASYQLLSVLDGGTSETDAFESVLYLALQELMTERHTYIISYQDTRDLYAYTDCVSNDSAQLVSFYSGTMHTSVWDAGKTWNREHTWPNSKCLHDKSKDGADIMMLRPTLKSENGSRSNTAYGESAGFYDPGESVRGDCARIALYMYTRWGNTSYMWGRSGVIENLDVLLRWMEEDPVDTWEMGRNDAVQTITGVRNIFVDYPEYAWLLFGEEVPADIVTPSGEAKNSHSGEIPDESEGRTETISETIPDTILETVSETIPDTIPETVFETVFETVLETVPETQIAVDTSPDTTVGTTADTKPETSGNTVAGTTAETVTEPIDSTAGTGNSPTVGVSGKSCTSALPAGTTLIWVGLLGLAALALQKRQKPER